MLEIIALTIIIILAFVAASWYSYKRSQERAAEFERELDLGSDDKNDAFQERFDALFEQELQTQAIQDREVDDVTVTIKSEQPQTEDLFEVSNEHETTMETIEVDVDDSEFSFDESVSSKPDNTRDDATSAVTENVNDWDMVVALTIMAPEANAFTGQAVKAALEQQELTYGEMQIYHRFTTGARKQTLFSIANILDPGTLVEEELDLMTTPGLLIFARLPGPINGMALFDELLETALAISNDLGGILCNDQRVPMTQAGIEEMRSRILNYQMTIQAETSQQSNDYFN